MDSLTDYHTHLRISIQFQADSEANVKVCVTYLKPFKWEYMGQNNVNLNIYADCFIDHYVWELLSKRKDNKKVMKLINGNYIYIKTVLKSVLNCFKDF